MGERDLQEEQGGGIICLTCGQKAHAFDCSRSVIYALRKRVGDLERVLAATMMALGMTPESTGVGVPGLRAALLEGKPICFRFDVRDGVLVMRAEPIKDPA